MRKRPSTLRALTIANEYLHGELPAQNAAYDLRRQGPFGKLLAGEVLLDQVTTDEPRMVSTRVTLARRDHEGVVAQTNGGQWRDGYDHIGSRVKAQMRLAQIEALAHIYRKSALPPHATVEKMYTKLLENATAALDWARLNRSSKVDSAMELRGTLGKYAVLLLAQRHALQEIGCEDWLPLQSSFSEDHAGDCLTDTGAYAWDLNIFTPGVGNEPQKTYSLKIRNYNDGSSPTPSGPTLYIYPDLMLRPTEQWTGQQIIASCDLEVRTPDRAARVTQELDARAEKLLDILG